uniref:Uncharacterized protein n=1 Tax=Rousettus aegyptiacus TaxID=9407 RepID=A0A7J8EKR0_ROUAE|nr:hypothetical protein HJG63_012582 [Rousettus aegyptiacus]
MARATKNTPAPSSRGKSTPKKQRGKEEDDHLSLPVQRQRRNVQVKGKGRKTPPKALKKKVSAKTPSPPNKTKKAGSVTFCDHHRPDEAPNKNGNEPEQDQDFEEKPSTSREPQGSQRNRGRPKTSKLSVRFSRPGR